MLQGEGDWQKKASGPSFLHGYTLAQIDYRCSQRVEQVRICAARQSRVPKGFMSNKFL
ncbi:hypothetical protein SAMN05192534_11423 [Alteribacillus persepolensis]|uniref:Uncharacterized protein n=1 Tax=Alteribacillus persepolensis TaxID=568899 RepID=A0A1G8G3I5_9BACI|nr:hypothetical protein SAMN05192534_11423 [Alteribacillus persepolensis]